jgi:hypothetical protein
MAYDSSIEERFEGMAKRLERAEQANRAMKIWGSIAFVALMTFGSGPFASDATAKKKPPAIVTATQEIDLASGGKTVASLRMVGGKPNLVFFDSAGKTVVDVGINGTALPTGHAAGITVLDGNEDIPGTGKIRAGFGVIPSGPEAGAGESTFDGNGVVRSAVGSTVDGSIAFAALYDATGVSRTGLTYDPGINFTGSLAMTQVVTCARQWVPALTVLIAGPSSTMRPESFVTKSSTFRRSILTHSKPRTELVTVLRRSAISWSQTRLT